MNDAERALVSSYQPASARSLAAAVAGRSQATQQVGRIPPRVEVLLGHQHGRRSHGDQRERGPQAASSTIDQVNDDHEHVGIERADGTSVHATAGLLLGLRFAAGIAVHRADDHALCRRQCGLRPSQSCVDGRKAQIRRHAKARKEHRGEQGGASRLSRRAAWRLEEILAAEGMPARLEPVPAIIKERMLVLARSGPGT
jgi:hypothetical protein